MASGQANKKTAPKKTAGKNSTAKKPAARKATKRAPGKTAKETRDAKRIANQKRLFLECVAEGHTVKTAAKAINVSRTCVYNWRDEDKKFSQGWDDAILDGDDEFEEEARRRAIKGVKEPIVSGGMIIGEKLKFSDTLLMFLMKARRPDLYNPTQKVDLSGNLALADMTDEQLNAIIKDFMETLKPE